MAGDVSRFNGKKGGRPKGSKSNHTLQAETAKAELIRAYIENIKPINEALISKAKNGDIQAIKELHDRVYGKANQAVDLTTKGERLGMGEGEADELAQKVIARYINGRHSGDIKVG